MSGIWTYTERSPCETGVREPTSPQEKASRGGAHACALELVLLAGALALEARRPSVRRTAAAALVVLTASGTNLIRYLAGLSARSALRGHARPGLR
jgi:hypothetical protein